MNSARNAAYGYKCVEKLHDIENGMDPGVYSFSFEKSFPLGLSILIILMSSCH